MPVCSEACSATGYRLVIECFETRFVVGFAPTSQTWLYGVMNASPNSWRPVGRLSSPGRLWRSLLNVPCSGAVLSIELREQTNL
jgi:hypothetical protein